jgi:hypothetical protein
VSDTPDTDDQPRETVCETFRGPAFTFTLEDRPEDGTVEVSGPDGEAKTIVVTGRQVKRRVGHFGRGTWTVTYQRGVTWR